MKICDNLTTAKLFEYEDCLLEGRAYQYIPRYFKEGEVDIAYVRTAMEGFSLNDDFTSDKVRFLRYEMGQGIFGLPDEIVTFYFDTDNVLIDYGISG